MQAVDLRVPEAPIAVINAALACFGQIDLLVNNAGATKRGDFLAQPDEDWNDGFALKFFGAMRCCRAAWTHLQARQGSIINICGIGGRTASAEFTVGGAVNAALLNFTNALADRGLKDGVRVNAINPGSIATERLRIRVQSFAKEHNIDEAAAAHRMSEKLGLRRFGTPEEIARTVSISRVSAECLLSRHYR